MDIYDIRALKDYLTHVLEPMLKSDMTAFHHWEEVIKTAEPHQREYSLRMKAYHEGKVRALAFAIVEFKGRFAEELKEGE